MSGERWASVAGFEGLYEVSSLGRVRSLPRTGDAARSNARVYGGGYLKCSLSNGYPKVVLCGDGRRVGVLVHVLVARAFLGEKPADKDLVAHWDGDSANSRASNLRWATFKENEGDKSRHGRRPVGNAVTGSRLTPEKVLAIRASPLGMTTLGRMFSVSKQTIRAIKSGWTWRHI